MGSVLSDLKSPTNDASHPAYNARRLLARPGAPVLASALLAASIHLFIAAPALVGDAFGFDHAARGLAGDGNLGDALTFAAARGYDYPFFLAPIYALGGDAGVAEWLQALVLVPLMTLFVYFAGREAFSRRAGLIAAWACALWFPAAWQTRFLLSEPLRALLMAALLALLAAMLARGQPRLGVAGGVVAGLLAVGHPAYQLLPFVLVVAVYVATRSGRVTGAFAAGSAVLLVPYALLVLGGAPRLGDNDVGSRTGGAWTFYVASRWQTDFTVVRDDYVLAADAIDVSKLERDLNRGLYVEPHLRARIEQRARDGDRELSDADFYAAGIENLRSRPSKLPLKLRRNLSTLFVLHGHPNLGAPAAGPSVWGGPIWRPLSVVLVLGALGGFAYLLVRRQNRLLLVIPALVETLVLLVPNVEARYVVPIWPTLFVLGAVVLERLAAHVSGAVRVAVAQDARAR